MGVSRRGLLAASAVAGAFGQGDDGDPELLAGWPALAVDNVLLEQAEERLRGGGLGASSDAFHRPGELVASQSQDAGVGPELAAAVGVHRGGSGRRLRTALLRASTASWASDIEEPTMRRLRASLMAHS
jgi:hypothetical protein